MHGPYLAGISNTLCHQPRSLFPSSVCKYLYLHQQVTVNISSIPGPWTVQDPPNIPSIICKCKLILHLALLKLTRLTKPTASLYQRTLFCTFVCCGKWYRNRPGMCHDRAGREKVKSTLREISHHKVQLEICSRGYNVSTWLPTKGTFSDWLFLYLVSGANLRP
jgi:hypothetical protein